MREHWRERAACRGWDVSIFYAPEDPDTELPAERRRREWRAKEICRRCVVREACLEWAILHQEKRGIWGGLTTLERKALMRERRRLEVSA